MYILFITVLSAVSLISAVSGTYLIQLTPDTNITSYLDEHPFVKTKLIRTYSFGGFRAIAADFDEEFINTLGVEPLVENISPDIVLRANVVTQTDAPRHLARISQRPVLRASEPLTYEYDDSAGEGIDAYVLDTGIYLAHPDFEGRAVEGADYTGEGSGDSNGHGTHVAGLIGSNTYGVAKKITLIEVKVLGATGGGSLSNVIAGLDYAANSRISSGRKGVANLSLGAIYNPILNSAITSAVQSGLAVVVAAGNDALPACAFSPASSREALTVGALDDQDDTIAPFSNWGHCVDLFTSGVHVVSLLNSDDGTIAYSGTSMASPIAAGIVGYFMGLGDSPEEAVARIKADATRGAICWLQILFRPFTPNKIGYNLAGQTF
ncbi:peptidase S8/S53 domain-containing protein [Lipomyces kononenkoae]|uniref:Peptidase S8/S53 domain-containing protein n=1 Tax=Lipomyces kononenkoae TaxID=34357 RepID=A0ACC3SYS1_LIPKO